MKTEIRDMRTRYCNEMNKSITEEPSGYCKWLEGELANKANQSQPSLPSVEEEEIVKLEKIFQEGKNSSDTQCKQLATLLEPIIMKLISALRQHRGWATDKDKRIEELEKQNKELGKDNWAIRAAARHVQIENQNKDKQISDLKAEIERLTEPKS